MIFKMCKDDRTIIDNKSDEVNGPDHMKTAFDPMKLKRYFLPKKDKLVTF